MGAVLGRPEELRLRPEAPAFEPEGEEVEALPAVAALDACHAATLLPRRPKAPSAELRLLALGVRDVGRPLGVELPPSISAAVDEAAPRPASPLSIANA